MVLICHLTVCGVKKRGLSVNLLIHTCLSFHNNYVIIAIVEILHLPRESVDRYRAKALTGPH